MDLQIWNALNKRNAAQRAYLQGNVRQYVSHKQFVKLIANANFLDLEPPPIPARFKNSQNVAEVIDAMRQSDPRNIHVVLRDIAAFEGDAELAAAVTRWLS